MNNSIIIVDDHKLVSKAIAELIQSFEKYSILFCLNNGKELMDVLRVPDNIPEIVLLDINMPVMNGYETMEALNKKYPGIKVLMLSMNDDELTIIRMIKAGARGFISKLADDLELKFALDSILEKGFYYTDAITGSLIKSLQEEKTKDTLTISDREKELLRLICTDLTYKEMASKMCLSPKTIDGYRDALFQKLGVKNRVSLAIYAIKNNYYNINE
jgi:DNA-binding NarL/FixJ family response regulator